MSKRYICDSCGMTLDEQASFCPTCGGKMRAEEISDPQPVNTAAEFNAQQPNSNADQSFNNGMNMGNNADQSFNNDMNVGSNTNQSFDDVMNNNNNAGIPPVPPAGMPPFNSNNTGSTGIPPVQPSAPYDYRPQPEPPKSSKDVLALLGMIFGIVSLVFCCMNLLDLPFAIAGVILSILGIKSIRRKGMAIAGIICSAIATLLCIVIFCSGVAAMKEAGTDFKDAFMYGFEQGLQDELDDNDDDDYYDYEYKYDYDWD